ncbi:GNAT family N-acetyltransferase [Acetobacteraceae bacterium H6797]|nr:GNAT family N-acetyltransferase [Acetobacteraceae bacterium H6797]
MTIAAARPSIELTDAPEAPAVAAINDGLQAFNQAASPFPNSRQLAVLLRCPETGEVKGGLLGRTMQFWLYIGVIFIPEAWRGQRLGEELLARAEEEARARGCLGMWLDTYDFQAPRFYEKQGFTKFGEIPDHPPGQVRSFYQKRFA